MSTVSVIIPVYKVEPYLRRCVDSVLAQTFQDFEMILVDDGSPDDCGAICDEYAARDARIHVIHKENGGLSSARNAGLAAAQGEYIYFADSDDYIDPELLERSLEGIQGYDMVSFDYRTVDEAGRVLRQYPYRHGSYSFSNEEELYRFLMGTFFPRLAWSAWSRMYRKSIIDRNGLFFEDNNRIYAEDLYFTFLYLLYCRTINCLDAAFYNYLIRSDSIVSVQAKKHNLGRMVELIKAIKQHLDAQPGFPLLKEKFPVLFEEIFSVALSPTRSIVGKNNVAAIREIICSDVQDLTFFRNQTAALFEHRKDLRARYGLIRSGEILSEYRYYLDGRLPNYRIRRFLLRLLRRTVRLIRYKRHWRSAPE